MDQLADFLTYRQAQWCDIEPIYELCRNLILKYEDPEAIDLPRVMRWVRRKIETAIGEYTVIYAGGEKAGYYRFCKNDDGMYEIDDLYIFPPFQNRGIGTRLVGQCCASAASDVMLYVFIKNERAVALYQRLGFEITKTVGGSRYIMKYRHTQENRP